MHVRFRCINGAFAVAIAVVFMAGPADAQFTINLPSLPKIKKDKPTPTPTPVAVMSTADASDNAGSTPTSTSGGGNPASQPSNTDCNGGAIGVHVEDIQTTMNQAREFRPGLRKYYVRDFNDDENKYLKAALSPAERKDYFGDDPDKTFFNCVNPKLDELAAVAEKTIVGYHPVGYTLGTPAEKSVLRRGVTDLNQAAVYNVGLNSANWEIITNDFGIPTRRKKFGTLWVKYPGDKYCKLIYVNLIQSYSGGGTYNASEPQFISWEFAGCPAGK